MKEISINTDSYITTAYKKSLEYIAPKDLVQFLISFLNWSSKNLNNALPANAVYLNAYNEKYLENLKNNTPNKIYPPIIVIKTRVDKPGSIGSKPFTGVKNIIPRFAVDNANIVVKDSETDQTTEQYYITTQVRDILVSFICYSDNDDSAYRLLKNLEQYLYYSRTLFGKYGINTSYSHGMSDNVYYTDEKISNLIGKELIWYFQMEEINVEPVSNVIDSFKINIDEINTIENPKDNVENES